MPSPESSTKPALAKLPTPAMPLSATSGGKSAEQATCDLRPASTPAPVITPAPGVSGIDSPEASQDGGSPKPAYTTPGELLKAAAEMSEEDARDLLLRELRLRGWREVELELIKPDCKIVISSRGSQLAFWIGRFREIAAQLSSLSFDDMGTMSRRWEHALIAAQYGYTRSAIRWIQFHNWRFGNQADQRKWRFWMLGNLWRELEVEPNLPAAIAGWLRKLLKQSKGEKEVLLNLWRADHDRWEFDKITARNLRPERIEKKH